MAALGAMGVEELQAEVRARQDAMLGPPKSQSKGGDGEAADSRAPPPPSMQSMREGLRRARSVLNAKLQEAASRGTAAGGVEEGGFLRFFP